MYNGKTAIIAIVLLGLLMFGCLGIGEQPKPADSSKSGDGGEVSGPSAKRPSFTIAGPVNGGEITTEGETAKVEVILETTDLTVKAPGGANKAGEGHFHITLDGKSDIVTTNKKYVFENVGLGEHSVKVEIKQNDHKSYVPKIVKSVTFTVKKVVVELVPKTYEVSIKNFGFEPKEITVKVGDSIKWTNDDKMPHTATSTGNFNTGAIASGMHSAVKMDKEGAFDYFCALHPNMKGKVVVVK